METIKINGKEVPVIKPAKVTTKISNKKTGVIYQN